MLFFFFFFFFFLGGGGVVVSGFKTWSHLFCFLFGFAGCWVLLFEALESAVQEYEDRSKVDAATLLQEVRAGSLGFRGFGVCFRDSPG